MSQQKITQLTPEQEALIPVYREKWRAIALSTERIDRQKATEAIKATYAVYLLKMTCPSTGYIHALRVPPNIELAREAIRWVNWGTDPEEFSVQT